MPLSEALSLLRAGNPQQAAALLESHLRQHPTDDRAWFLLGACRHALNDLPAAAAAFGQSIELEPASTEARIALITVLRDAGDRTSALIASQRSLAIAPGNARLLYAAALCLEDAGRDTEALAYYESALQLAPDMDDALHNRGLLLTRLERFEEAELNHRRYVELRPGVSRAHLGFADFLIAQRRYVESLDSLAAAERLFPSDATIRVRRGIALAALQRYAEARDNFARACDQDRAAVARYLHRIAPNAHAEYLLSARNVFLWHTWLAMGQCDWSSWHEAASDLTQWPAADVDAIDPAIGFMALHMPLTGEQRHAVTRRIAKHIEAHAPVLPAPLSRSRERIRVGMLSPDLREHIIGYLLLPFFELLDRERFELYAYSLISHDGSAIAARLCRAAHEYRDLSLVSDEQAAAQIRRDDIDVLIDVGGYTTGARFGIAARRPARVQVLYLGFAGSLGSTRVDYVITDRVVTTSRSEWSETPVHLPHTYYVYDFRERIPDAPVSRRDYALPDEAFVYCAFHRPEKISPDTFRLWCRILNAVPHAVLWLLSLTPAAQRNLRRAAALQGVASERLVFAPFEHRHDPRYLARHRLGDLMLDALHHNAIATASDALAGGLPLVTMIGSAMASRSGASLLLAAGLPELVVTDQDAYVTTAIELALDRKRLESCRLKLAAREGLLFDTKSRVKELELALLEMWRRHEQRL